VPVEQRDVGLRDLGAAGGVAAGVHVDAAQHGGAHVLDRARLPDAGGVVVDEVALELLDLLVGQHQLGELADPRVRAVHDFARLELAVQHLAAGLDPLQCSRVEQDLLAVAGDPDDVLDLQVGSVDADWHVTSPGKPHAGSRPAALHTSTRNCRRRSGV
jgi:hypothetical protein